MNSALLKGLDRVGAGMHAVFWFGRLVLPTKEVLLFATATRCRMSADSRFYSYLRSTWSVSLDALGAQMQCWSLRRLLECYSWSHIVSRRISVSCPTNRHV